MMVIPEEEQVELEFRATSAEWLGWLVTVGMGFALLFVVGFSVLTRVRRPLGRSPVRAEPSERTRARRSLSE
jgi:hypothetical protein